MRALTLTLLTTLAAAAPVAAQPEVLPRFANPRDVASLERLVRTAKDAGVPFKLSLTQLAADCAAQKGALPDSLRQMRGFNWFFGFAIDRAAGDVYLLGYHDPEKPPIDLDCWVSALRAAWDGAEPFCSLDPDPDPRWQKAVVGGVARESRAASVLIGADYVMKSIAQGREDPKLPGLTSWADRLVASKSLVGNGGAQQLNRWWFTRPPKAVPHTLVVDDDVVVLTLNPVILRSELAADGAFGTGATAGEAEEFARDFTRNLTPLSKKYGSIARLLAVYRLVDLATHLKHFLNEANLPLPGKEFWLTGYASPCAGPPQRLPTLTRRWTVNEGNQTVEYQVAGGVMIPLKLEPRTFSEVRGKGVRKLVAMEEPAFRPEALLGKDRGLPVGY
jgi:hypothetical protein